MRNFIAAAFTTEAAAYEGLRALQRLHGDGTITLYETVVIERRPTGEIVTQHYRQSERPLNRTAVGALLGALAGAFAGPVGIALGGSVGIFGGAIDDAIRWTVSDEYVERIERHVPPGSFAVIAEVHESELAPVDAAMAALGGRLFRETRRDFFGDLLQKRVEAHRAAARHQRLDHHERETLRRTAREASDELEDTRRELEEKLRALDEQVAAARPGVREDLERRMADLRRDFDERERKLSSALDTANEALHH